MKNKVTNFAIDRTIFFFEDVFRDSAEDFIKELYRLDGENNNDIYIIINSWGGSVSAMFAMIDAISSVKSNVNTVVLGEADSAAAVLTTVGHKRYIGSNSKMMIHEVSSVSMGKLSQIESELEGFREIQDKILNILVKNSKKTKDEIEEIWRGKDVWLDSKESVEFGLVDEVIVEKEEDFVENFGGKSLITASVNSLDKKELDYIFNVKKMFNNVRNNKKETDMSAPTTNQKQLEELITRVSDLTNSVTTLQEEKSNAIKTSEKIKNESNVKIAELTSKLDEASKTIELNNKRDREEAVDTLTNTLASKFPKEVSEEVTNILKEAKISTNMVKDLNKAFEKVGDSVITNKLPVSQGGEELVFDNSDSDLEVMTPQ